MRKIRESGEGTAGAYGFFFNLAWAAESDVGVAGELEKEGGLEDVEAGAEGINEALVVATPSPRVSASGTCVNTGADMGGRDGATTGAGGFFSGDKVNALRDCAACAD